MIVIDLAYHEAGCHPRRDTRNVLMSFSSSGQALCCIGYVCQEALMPICFSFSKLGSRPPAATRLTEP